MINYIKEPFEWMQTGIVEGAIPLTLNPNIGKELEKIKDGRQIALFYRIAIVIITCLNT